MAYTANVRFRGSCPLTFGQDQCPLYPRYVIGASYPACTSPAARQLCSSHRLHRRRSLPHQPFAQHAAQVCTALMVFAFVLLLVGKLPGAQQECASLMVPASDNVRS